MDITVTYEKNRLHIDTLIAQFGRRGSVIPFIGAGCSIPSGFPGWRHFLSDLLQTAIDSHLVTSPDAENLRQGFDQRPLEETGDALWTRIGESIFRDKLQDVFRRKGRVIEGAVYQVPLLTANLILTTNYDRVIETVWEEHLRRTGSDDEVEVLTPNNDDFERALTGSGRFVFKLHGDVESPETWVLTKHNYYAKYGSFAPLPQFLQRLMSSHIPLFIGCSLQDERILDAMKAVGRSGYAILASTNERERHATATRLRDLVKVIWLTPAEDTSPTANIHALLEPLLALIAHRARLGKIVWPAAPQRDEAWDAMLKRFETTGQYEAAIDWILGAWPSLKSWRLAIQLLHFSDLLGRPNFGLEKYAELRESLDFPPDHAELLHADQYYVGRMLGQLGLLKQAIDQHTKNIPGSGIGDIFQIRSLFEISQLLFRVEDFDGSWRKFRHLWSIVRDLRGEDSLVADIAKFMATLEVVDRIHDLPFSSNLTTLAWQGTAEGCLEYAEFAHRHAETSRYDDGRAWALCVKAFGLEVSGDWPRAEDAYAKALEVCQTGACHRSSSTHIQVYIAGFWRRRGDLERAEAQLGAALETMPSKGRPKDRARIYEHLALVLNLKGDTSKSEETFRAALRLYAQEPAFPMWVEWPIVQRLRRTCTARGIDLRGFLEADE